VGHRERLVETIQRTSQWRHNLADDYDEEGQKLSRMQNRRSALALARLANFVRDLPEDDPDLGRCKKSEIARDGRSYILGEEAARLLGRFWINRAAAKDGGAPTEAQMRNLLRRMDGAEQRHRAAGGNRSFSL